MFNRAKTFSAFAMAFALSATAVPAAVITVDVHAPSGAEIADDPTLADATIIDLLIDSEGDLLLSFDINLTTVGTLYNHPLEEADDAAANAAAVLSFPSLGADSHVAFGERIGGNLASPSGNFPVSVAGPLAPVAHNGIVARITVLNDPDATIEGTAFFSADGTTSFDLAYETSGLEGDLNGDGFVGIADLNIVLGDWNKTVPPADPAADPSGDNFVGIADLNTVLGNWNAGTPPINAVPEPAAFALLGLGALALARRH